MPVDTRSKRASALVALRPWVLAAVLPDSTLSQGDRQHAAFMYSGILAAAEAEPAAYPAPYVFHAPADPFTFRVPADPDFKAPLR